jgi:Protein of unknown function (DUF3455)
MNKILSSSLTLMLVTVTGSSAHVLAELSPTVQATVPDSLQVPENQKLLFRSYAEGEQIYICKSKPDNSNVFEWTLKAPRADLYDRKAGKLIGSHYGGPTWDLKDGSKIVGKVSTKADAPQAETAIPWLLLEVKENAGKGNLKSVKWIQRVNTVGGKATAQDCKQGNQNQEQAVPYAADYYFFGAQSN